MEPLMGHRDITQYWQCNTTVYLPDVPVVHRQLTGRFGGKLKARVLPHLLQVPVAHLALVRHACIFKVCTLAAAHKVIEAILHSMHHISMPKLVIYSWAWLAMLLSGCMPCKEQVQQPRLKLSSAARGICYQQMHQYVVDDAALR